MSRVKINVFNVTKVEVSEIAKVDGTDGVFYTAYIHITNTDRCCDMKLSEVSKEKLKAEYQHRDYLSGEVTQQTSICLFADTKKALKVKLDAFKG
tara:strand:+ start:40410 stop:40694 length:285 start_codon:yes stop_codon:yes gene_type:complete